MKPADFPESNRKFGPPPGMSESQVQTIDAYMGKIDRGPLEGAEMVVTAWQPDADDLARLNAGGVVYLSFIGGLPPHCAATQFPG